MFFYSSMDFLRNCSPMIFQKFMFYFKCELQFRAALLQGHLCLRGNSQDRLYSELNLRFYEAFQGLAEHMVVEVRCSCSTEVLGSALTGHACPLAGVLGGQRGGFPFCHLRQLCSCLVAKLSINVRTKVEFLSFFFFCFVLISLIPKCFKV